MDRVLHMVFHPNTSDLKLGDLKFFFVDLEENTLKKQTRIRGTRKLGSLGRGPYQLRRTSFIELSISLTDRYVKMY